MINDISAGTADENMLPTAGRLDVAYIMMHMQGNPQTMQVKPHYEDIVRELIAFFALRIETARKCGIKDIIIDPGFGFGKTIQHNFELLRDLELFRILEVPVMVGLSRKSMIYKPLDLAPEMALNGTSVANTLALHNGARLLRVHDVKEAVQAVKLFTIYNRAGK
jgi:dihydropteroate synthase